MTFVMSASEIGEILGITSRRVAQYRDEGLLPTIQRGRFDFGWLALLRLGEKITKNITPPNAPSH